MINEILIIPDKADKERDSIADYWKSKGGEVLRINKFWEKPEIQNKRVSIYGNDTFCLVLAQILNVDLIIPKDEIVCELDYTWTKRKIVTKSVIDISDIIFPVFIKPVKPKTFKSKIYNTLIELKREIDGIESNEQIILSSIIEIQKEVRAFILDKKIKDIAFYEGDGDIEKPTIFLKDFLENCGIDLPKSFVVDLGYNEKDKWFIIEFNSCWGAGLNFCKPDRVIECIREATIN